MRVEGEGQPIQKHTGILVFNQSLLRRIAIWCLSAFVLTHLLGFFPHLLGLSLSVPFKGFFDYLIQIKLIYLLFNLIYLSTYLF